MLHHCHTGRLRSERQASGVRLGRRKKGAADRPGFPQTLKRQTCFLSKSSAIRSGQLLEVGRRTPRSPPIRRPPSSATQPFPAGRPRLLRRVVADPRRGNIGRAHRRSDGSSIRSPNKIQNIAGQKRLEENGKVSFGANREFVV